MPTPFTIEGACSLARIVSSLFAIDFGDVAPLHASWAPCLALPLVARGNGADGGGGAGGGFGGCGKRLRNQHATAVLLSFTLGRASRPSAWTRPTWALGASTAGVLAHSRSTWCRLQVRRSSAQGRARLPAHVRAQSEFASDGSPCAHAVPCRVFFVHLFAHAMKLFVLETVAAQVVRDQPA